MLLVPLIPPASPMAVLELLGLVLPSGCSVSSVSSEEQLHRSEPAMGVVISASEMPDARQKGDEIEKDLRGIAAPFLSGVLRLGCPFFVYGSLPR